jgi:hypothetical protein
VLNTICESSFILPMKTKLFLSILERTMKFIKMLGILTSKEESEKLIVTV